MLIEQYRREYNHVRPDNYLDYRPRAHEARIPVTSSGISYTAL